MEDQTKTFLEKPEQIKEDLQSELDAWVPELFAEILNYKEYKQVIDKAEVFQIEQISQDEYVVGVKLFHSEEASVKREEYLETQRSRYERIQELLADYKETYDKLKRGEEVLLISIPFTGIVEDYYFIRLYEEWMDLPNYSDEELAKKYSDLMEKKKTLTELKKQKRGEVRNSHTEIFVKCRIDNQNNVKIQEYAMPKVSVWQHADYPSYHDFDRAEKLIDRLRFKIDSLKKVDRLGQINDRKLERTISTPVFLTGIFSSGKSTLVEWLKTHYVGIAEEVHQSEQILGNSGVLFFPGDSFIFHPPDIDVGNGLKSFAFDILALAKEVIINGRKDIYTRIAARLETDQRLRDVSLALDTPALYSGSLIQMLFGSLAYYKQPPINHYYIDGDKNICNYSFDELEDFLMQEIVNIPNDISSRKELDQLINIVLDSGLENILEFAELQKEININTPWLELRSRIKEILISRKIESIPKLADLQSELFIPKPGQEAINQILSFANKLGIPDLLKSIFEHLDNPESIVFTGISEETWLNSLDGQNNENRTRRAGVVANKNWYKIWDVASRIIIKHNFPNIRLVNYNWQDDWTGENLEKRLEYKQKYSEFTMWDALEKSSKNIYYFGHVDLNLLKKGFDDLKEEDKLNEFMSMVESESRQLAKTYFEDYYDMYFQNEGENLSILERSNVIADILKDMSHKVDSFAFNPSNIPLSTYIQSTTSKKEPFRLLRQLMLSFQKYLGEGEI
jgi:hypothetical protein